MKKDIQKLVGVNRPGWYCLRHKDGWFIGTKKGVTCYATMELAQAALTIAWQRDGGGALHYRITGYQPAQILAGEHTPLKSAAQALRDYERQSP